MIVTGERRRRSAILLVLGLAAGVTGSSVGQPSVAAGGPVFTVMNTSETPPDGVWFRNSPHTSDTDRVTGHGVYVNERVELQCYAWGDSVGAYNNTLWYFVLNVTRPTNAGVTNSGYLNAHYINDGLAANQIDAGVSQCGSAPPPQAAITLSQGPAAPAGFWYSISLDNFAGGATISVTCRDSVDPGGFKTFSLTTNGAGHTATQAWCYSGDGPDHWVTANGVESNHVQWGPGSGGGTPTTSPSGSAVASLAQGPDAPHGYWYAITLSHFPSNSAIAISCRDSVDPDGFSPFSLNTDGSGSAFTQGYCFSGDGPDHWFTANGIESNHLTWGVAPSGGAPTSPPLGDASVPASATQPATRMDPPTSVNLFFNRTAAVNWALGNAQDQQDVDVMCTWFVSNALWAGGFPKSPTWTDAGSHGTIQKRPGTVTAWAVPEFVQYMKDNFSTAWEPLGLLTNTNNAVPDAQPGDIIAYDWGDGGGISHVSFVVDIAPGQYPIVSEWGQSPYTLIYGRSFTSPYQKRGWTYSELNGKWLQDVHGGNVHAYLLHINGGLFIANF